MASIKRRESEKNRVVASIFIVTFFSIGVICLFIGVIKLTQYEELLKESRNTIIKITYPDGSVSEFTVNKVSECDNKLYLEIKGEETTKVIFGYSHYEVTFIEKSSNKDNGVVKSP